MIAMELFVIGVNHHLTNAEERSKYSLSQKQQLDFYNEVKRTNHSFCIIVNTCNRTEIYGVGNYNEVIGIYKSILNIHDFNDLHFIRKFENEAAEHIIEVACGLDSKVIGDLEILGQIKQAFQIAKKLKVSNGFLERLINTAIQAAKQVRTETKISSGTVSLSYAAVKFINKVFGTKNIDILLVGTGEFGKRIAFNIKDYLPQAQLTLCNRTTEKAALLAENLECKTITFTSLAEEAYKYDVIISAVNDTGNFLITEKILSKEKSDKKILIDMSIPFSIDPKLANDGHTLLNIDDISLEVSQTLESRKSDIPIAESIIQNHLNEFLSWTEVYKNSETIRQWKGIMQRLSGECSYLNNLHEQEKNKFVHRSLSDFANFIKQNSDLPKESEEIIYHFLNKSSSAFPCQKSLINQEDIPNHNCSVCQAR